MLKKKENKSSKKTVIINVMVLSSHMTYSHRLQFIFGVHLSVLSV